MNKRSRVNAVGSKILYTILLKNLFNSALPAITYPMMKTLLFYTLYGIK